MQEQGGGWRGCLCVLCVLCVLLCVLLLLLLLLLLLRERCERCLLSVGRRWGGGCLGGGGKGRLTTTSAEITAPASA